MGLVMQLLAMPNIPHGAIRKVSESTEIPMGAIRRWRRDGFSTDPPSRALNARQQSDLAERFRVEYVLAGRYCSPATANRLALAMRADSLASQSSSPEIDRETIWTTVPTLCRTFAPSGQQGVNALAQELGIRLVFIPAGITGLSQQLDRGIFGSLKAGARAPFDRL
jgi:hypothetical protein